MGAKFGPAGNSESFQAMGYRKTIQVPEYITRMGLDAYEYQCGRGVRISEEAARAFGEKAREHQVTLSLHSPYYISLSGIEEEKRLGSIEYILQSARAADAMGAQRVVVHSGPGGAGAHPPVPRDDGQAKPAGNAGGGAGAVPIRRAADSLHRFWPPECPYLRRAQQL